MRQYSWGIKVEEKKIYFNKPYTSSTLSLPHPPFSPNTTQAGWVGCSHAKMSYSNMSTLPVIWSLITIIIEFCETHFFFERSWYIWVQLEN